MYQRLMFFGLAIPLLVIGGGFGSAPSAPEFLPPTEFVLTLAPDTLLVTDRDAEVTYTASLTDRGGRRVEPPGLVWQSTDAAVAESLGGGRFSVMTSGQATVVVKVAGNPEVTAQATLIVAQRSPAAEPRQRECDDPAPEWVWCDDFEVDRLAQYFEYNERNGSFVRSEGAGVGGAYGMRARWSHVGQVNAGDLKLAIGRTPGVYFRSVDDGIEHYREIYWRFYVRHEEDWTGGGADKLSRVTSFAGDDWSQAMIAHLWSGSGSRTEYLVIDPASGTDRWGKVQTTRYNDFGNLRWLGLVPSRTPIFSDAQVGRWYCVEAHVRLNEPGLADGSFALWIDERQEAAREHLNWIGDYQEFGINAVFLENYRNDGAVAPQERYFDRFVVSTARISC